MSHFFTVHFGFLGSLLVIVMGAFEESSMILHFPQNRHDFPYLFS